MPVCAAIGCVSPQRLIRRRRWGAIPPLPGCQALLPHGGAAPIPPAQAAHRGPVGTGRQAVAAPAVQGRRAGRSFLASPDEVVGVAASLRPGVTARQESPLGGRPSGGGAPVGRGGKLGRASGARRAGASGKPAAIRTL